MIKHSSTVAKVGAKDSVVIAGYVARPMISKNATKELVGGAVAGYAYDLVTQSSGSSSERNGTHVGPGGNKKRPDTYSIPQTGFKKKAGTKGPCDDGYVLAKVKGRWLCMKKWDYFVGNQSPRKD